MKQNKTNLLLAVILILAAAISKVISYPHTFTPIIAMALFGGAVIKDKRFAFVLPVFAMFISDILLEASGIAKGFYGWSQVINYGILLLVTAFGFLLKKINIINVAGFSLASSAIFYILSNLSFFLIDNKIYHTYTNDFNGFIRCYWEALPYAKFHVDLIFSALLFGVYYLITTYATNNKQLTA